MDCGPPGSSIQGFPRPEYWSGLPSPSPGDPPDPGIDPGSFALQVNVLPSEPPGNPPMCFGNVAINFSTRMVDGIQEGLKEEAACDVGLKKPKDDSQ